MLMPVKRAGRPVVAIFFFCTCQLPHMCAQVAVCSVHFTHKFTSVQCQKYTASAIRGSDQGIQSTFVYIMCICCCGAKQKLSHTHAHAHAHTYTTTTTTTTTTATTTTTSQIRASHCTNSQQHVLQSCESHRSDEQKIRTHAHTHAHAHTCLTCRTPSRCHCRCHCQWTS